MRDLCIDIVQQLTETQTPFLLAMKIPQEKGSSESISSSDLLKYLIKQAIEIRKNYQSEKSMALSCAMFHGASAGMDWFRLLEIVLADIDDTVYIIVDLDIMDKSAPNLDGFSWISAFESFFANLKTRGLSTKIKVLFVNYGAQVIPLSTTDRAKFVVTAKTEIVTARQRKAGRGVQPQQMCFRLRNLPPLPARRSVGD